ncbi:hypothetical protein BWI17_21680 [Betaproteobacteria bacterium GR16-43]|nr:hypothetical protein BWI17_21680 [Betaproteobacteria bacterium GR16-43]
MIETLMLEFDETHRRIRRYCGLIVALADDAALRGVDSHTREGASCVLRFFDAAGLQHHRDEEEGLFPLLARRARGDDAIEVAAFMAALASQHGELDATWRRVRAMLCGLAGGGFADTQFPGAARALEAAYDRRIRYEEAQAMPVARRILNEAMAAQLGAKMAKRRERRRFWPF